GTGRGQRGRIAGCCGEPLMIAKKLLWLPLVVVALACATCAPVDQPTSSNGDETPTAAESATPAEKLPIQPLAQPSGPRARIEAAVRHVRQREMLTTNGFWTVFHGILGLGPGVT